MAAVPRVSAAARFFAVLRGARLEIPAKPEPELRDSGRMAGFGGLVELFTRPAVGGKGARPGRKDEVPAADLHRADQKPRNAAARGAVLRTLSQHLPSDRAPCGAVRVAVGERITARPRDRRAGSDWRFGAVPRLCNRELPRGNLVRPQRTGTRFAAQTSFRPYRTR